MKTASLFSTLFCLILLSAGCASHESPMSVGRKAEPSTHEGLGFSINTQSSLVIGRQFAWWPETDFGYELPGGTYKPECEDADGIFFKAPTGLNLNSVHGTESVKGGIYLPKSGATGLRGHVYLYEPGILGGWKIFVLPDEFFAGYGNTWVLLDANGQHLPAPYPLPGVH